MVKSVAAYPLPRGNEMRLNGL